MEVSRSLRGRFSTGNNLGTHWIGGLGGPQGKPGRFGEAKNILPLPGFECRAVQPVA